MRNDHFIRNAAWATRQDPAPAIWPRVAGFLLNLLALAAFLAIMAMVLVCFV